MAADMSPELGYSTRSRRATAGLLPYIYVDTIDVTTELIQAHGGEIIEPPSPEGNLLVGTFRDPAGNVLGLWQEVATPDAT